MLPIGPALEPASTGWVRPQSGGGLGSAAGKVAVNQLVMSPGLNGCFFCFAILTRESPRARYTADKGARMLKKLRTDLPRTMLRSNAFWICSHTPKDQGLKI